MGKAHQNKKKTAQPKSETNARDTRKINTITRKQIPHIQSSTQTHMDLWNSSISSTPHANQTALLKKRHQLLLSFQLTTQYVPLT
jgi:hypothetical protein